MGISIWRTILIVHLNKEDIFLTIGFLSVATNLEPLLGICVACILVCRVLLVIGFQKLKTAGYTTFSHLSNNHSHQHEPSKSVLSSAEQPDDEPTRAVDRKNFRRLHDNLYPLYDLIAVTCIEGSVHDHSVDRPLEGQRNGIRITETWDVVSQQQV